ncbi:undecaprenyl/decaprenyl-phosphate alpha-N-acetylglucosaminyl 1-phosphate transferase [Balneolaceae bacterium YR4-1]|uniref:Undecaprenyl/decaprenyl-phosphate alpha-N-acetylglucosaminyl 1-phosphate transferase n=1 Tax=Halalkalibaculum roseum TaxID=2709311 RepID=A0A6M1SV16_9BACT|nr:MraY family glycosyltransferase [Halalkalibaculum roseum]NGP76662.1 undecaprenyl/decaprenyl-phosphate alpha-N-acetylglucosaminyl 1-phosphate transferase [Halalkalibaculum roseum]
MNIEFLMRVVPAVFTSVIICFISIPVIIKIAELKKLMDEPDKKRKIHKEVVPTLGGIGIFAAFMISFSIWGSAASLESYPFFVAGLFILLLVGIRDDILTISPNKKLLIQLLAAAEIVIGGGVVLTDFGGILGIYQVPWYLGAGITILAFVSLINAINLIDGIDGLAGGIGIVVSSILGIWFWYTGFVALSVLAFSLSGALIGFLIYNVHPAKIFMGDTGSMAVGFILAYLVIQFLVANSTVVSSGWYIENAHIFAISLLIIPIVDTLRVFTLRVASGKSPFVADRNHTHHQLLDVGMSPEVASFSLWMGNFALIAAGFFLNGIDANILLFLILLGGFGILPLTKFLFASYLKYNRKLAYYSYLRSQAGSQSDYESLKEEMKKLIFLNKSKKENIQDKVGEAESS